MMDHFPGVIFNDAATRDSGLVRVVLHAKSMPEQEQVIRGSRVAKMHHGPYYTEDPLGAPNNPFP